MLVLSAVAELGAQGPSALPMVKSVEHQPLAAQVKRLVEALEFLGVPLQEAQHRALETATREVDAQKCAAGVQAVLDSHCLLGVELDAKGTMDTQRRFELNMWYHTLNCGLRVRASGETDFPCISGARVGMGRVYVKIAGRLDYDDWCEGIRQGRSYVSDGTSHLMEFAAATSESPPRAVPVGMDGSELKLDKPATIRLTAMSQRGWTTSACP